MHLSLFLLWLFLPQMLSLLPLLFPLRMSSLLPLLFLLRMLSLLLSLSLLRYLFPLLSVLLFLLPLKFLSDLQLTPFPLKPLMTGLLLLLPNVALLHSEQLLCHLPPAHLPVLSELFPPHQFLQLLSV